MVFEHKRNTNAAYLDTTATNKSSTSSSNTAHVHNIVDYFAVCDGSPESDKRFRQAFCNYYHPDVIIELPGHNLNFDAAVECLQAGIDKGGRSDLLDVVDNNDGTATMTICNNGLGLKDDVTRQVAYFKDGKVIRVHALEQDLAQFGNVLSHYQRCIPSEDSKEIASRWADMIACFDGPPDAYTNVLPIIEEIFSPELIIKTDNGQQDLKWWKDLAESFCKQRNSASVEHLELTSTGIRVAVRHVVDGVDQGPVAQLGTIVDGKITYWSPEDEAGYDKLVTSVDANQDGMAGNIQRDTSHP
ncbi:hypothetical protein ACHAWF_001265 [Thalassiosira exigua]